MSCTGNLCSSCLEACCPRRRDAAVHLSNYNAQHQGCTYVAGDVFVGDPWQSILVVFVSDFKGLFVIFMVILNPSVRTVSENLSSSTGSPNVEDKRSTSQVGSGAWMRLSYYPQGLSAPHMPRADKKTCFSPFRNAGLCLVRNTLVHIHYLRFWLRQIPLVIDHRERVTTELYNTRSIAHNEHTTWVHHLYCHF